MSKSLVAYFSATGTTEKLAKDLSNAIGADLYEIKPKTPYTKKDLNWLNPLSRTTKEMHKKGFRPPVADNNANVGEYDVIFVGFPVWWYVAPTIINTFLESYDFSGKRIVLFGTSGGSQLGKSAEKLLSSVSDSAEIISGKVLNGNPSSEELKSFAEQYL